MARPDRELADFLENVAGNGPHLVYVDGSQGEPYMSILTRETEGLVLSGGEMSDRRRALVRALLHLAQDRLDHANPHD